MASGSELASAWISIYPKFSKDFNSSVSGAVGKIGTGVVNKIGSTLSVTLGNVFATAINTTVSEISKHAAGAIERADTLNNFPRMMANFGYSADDAAKVIDRLDESIQGLPTTLDSIASATSQLAPLRNSLADAGDLAVALNDAIVAGGQSATLQENAMEQFSQMLAVGKVDAAAWRSVINAMPAQLGQLSKALLGADASVWDLYDSMQKGTTTFDDFIEKLIELDSTGFEGLPSFAEQAKTATAGIGTALTNLENRIKKAGTTIIEGIGVDRIADAINGFSSQFGGWANKAVEFIQQVEGPAVNLGRSLLGVGAAVKDVVMSSGLLNVGTIISALDEASYILDNYISPFISGFGGRLTSAAATLVDVLKEATRLLLDWYSAVRYAFSISSGYLSDFTWGALALAREVAGDLLPVLQTAAVTYIPLAARGAATLVSALRGAYARVAPALTSIVYSVMPALVSAVDLILGRIGVVTDVVGVAVDVAARAIGDIAPRLIYFAADLLPRVDAAVSTIAYTIAGLYDEIAPTILGLADSIVPKLGTALTRIVRIVTAPELTRILGIVTRGAASGISRITQYLGVALDIVETIAASVAEAAGVVEGLIPLVLDLADSVLPTIVTLVVDAISVARDIYSRVAPSIVRLAETVIPALGRAFNAVIDVVEGPVISVFERMADIAARVIDGISDRVPGVMDAFLGTLGGPVASALDRAAGLAVDLVSAIVDRLPQALDILSRLAHAASELASALLPVLTGFMRGTLGAVFESAEEPLDTLLDGVLSIADYLTSLVEDHKDDIVGFVSDVSSGLGGLISTVAELARKLLPEARDNVIEIWHTLSGDTELSIVTALFDKFGRAITFVATNVSDVFSAIANGISNIDASTLDTIRDAISRIGAVLSQLWDDNRDLIFELVETLIPKLAGRLGLVASGVARVFEMFAPGAVDFLKTYLPVVIEKVGAFARATLPKIRSLVTEVFDAIKTGFSNIDSSTFDSIRDSVGRIGTVLSDLWTDNKGTILQLIETLIPRLAELLAIVANGVAGVVEALAPNITDFIQNYLPGILETIGNFARDVLPRLFEYIERIAAWLTPDRAATLAKIVGTVMALRGASAVIDVVAAGLDKLSSYKDGIKALAEHIGLIKPNLDDVTEAAEEAAEAVGDLGDAFDADKIADSIPDISETVDIDAADMPDVTGNLDEIADDVAEKTRGVVENAESITRTGADGMREVIPNAMSEMADDIYAKSPEIADAAAQASEDCAAAMARRAKEHPMVDISEFLPDKKSMEERLAWSEDIMDRMADVIDSPLDNIAEKVDIKPRKLNVSGIVDDVDDVAETVLKHVDEIDVAVDAIDVAKPFTKGKGTILKHLGDIGGKVSGVGSTLSTTFSGAFGGLGTKLGSIVGGIGPKLAGLGTTLSGAMGTAVKAIAALFTGPVGIAAVITGALVGAFVAFTPEGRQIFEDFVGRIKGLWDEKIAQPFSQFVETLRQVYEEQIKPHVDNLIAALTPAVSIIADTLGDAIETIFNNVKGVFDFLNSPEGKPVLDVIAAVINTIIDAIAFIVRWVMTLFSIVRRLAELLVTVQSNLIKAVHNFFDAVFNNSRDQWGYDEWTDPLHSLGEDIQSLWKDDNSILAGPMRTLGDGLISATDAINANTQATTGAKDGVSTSLKEMYEATEAARANQIANATYPLNTKPVQVNIDGKKVAQATSPAITTAGGTYVMSYQRGM